MKIALINDTHFGYKNSSSYFLSYQQSFFDNVFFPYCEKHGIKDILHLGDLFDTRKHVTIKALNFTRTKFFEELRRRGITMNVICGNHDVYYNNTNDLCTLVEVLQPYADCIRVHMKPAVLKYDGFPIAVVPWIAADNHNECMEFIRTAPASVIAGHFSIGGFKYIANSNIKSEGLSQSLFAKYDLVMSGHYHTKSSAGNVTYLGSQYQFNWSDVDDRKYFHVYDTSTRELTPVENKERLYVKFYYDDSTITKLSDLIQPDVHSSLTIKNNYVRIIVTKKRDYHLFDAFIERIKSFEPYDLSIAETYELATNQSGDVSTASLEDTTALIDDYVDKVLNTDLNKERIKKMLHQLHAEALMADSI